jgi:polyphosphate kinase 2 (PPK2 family)
MDYGKSCIVKPGQKVRLAKINLSYTGAHKSNEEVEPKIRQHVERLDALQYLLYADHSRSLPVILQALDAAGKDGVIPHLFTGMNPQGTSVFCFKQPSKSESDHDFLWLPHMRAPWYVILSNHKWFRNLAISRIVTETLKGMGLKLPPTNVDIADIRRKYHAAELGEQMVGHHKGRNRGVSVHG